MSDAALAVLSAFEALPKAEREEVVRAVLRLNPRDFGPITDEDLATVTDQLYLLYDAEEAVRLSAPPAAARSDG